MGLGFFSPFYPREAEEARDVDTLRNYSHQKLVPLPESSPDTCQTWRELSGGPLVTSKLWEQKEPHKAHWGQRKAFLPLPNSPVKPSLAVQELTGLQFHNSSHQGDLCSPAPGDGI